MGRTSSGCDWSESQDLLLTRSSAALPGVADRLQGFCLPHTENIAVFYPRHSAFSAPHRFLYPNNNNNRPLAVLVVSLSRRPLPSEQ